MTRSLSPPDWIEAREYQEEAIRAWMNEGGAGILRMATGTGKTVTGLLAASRVAAAMDGQLLLIVAAPYQHLVDQWAEDLYDFGMNPVLAYQSRRNWQPRLEREILEYNTGSRGICTVVTTHTTLAIKGARTTLQRAEGPSMLIADEVHHLGSKHMQSGLLDAFDFRLGLSATPERWFDEEGTNALHAYFGDTVFEYDLADAIEVGALCEYYYVPHIVELDEEETEVYLQLSEKIGRLMSRRDDEEGFSLEDDPRLQRLLIKRARLVGTARTKLDVLVDLIDRQDSVSYSLVYCSDGSMGPEGDGERHVDAATTRLGKERGLQVEPFTAEESQAEREELLQAFGEREIDVLTAIRCLDEGVDVPATRTAYILASSSNPRQYIQRRGRILRTYEGKQFAVIHDFITVPAKQGSLTSLSGDSYTAERRLFEKELRRVSMFADDALNHPDAEVGGVPTTDGSLQQLKRRYDLLDA
ncbi:DEAD/DEAH box helicase family protein [Halococcus sp. PRR34]|uniref:DEAD/DEAH box helicase family protein n=1 Tax=Halococcus sp. PRR34 TaxID=3020830 RepID=UPI00236299B6|nr:DEAD/DEAH box helicase family protein [Halococcus sp. PRR34]